MSLDAHSLLHLDAQAPEPSPEELFAQSYWSSLRGQSPMPPMTYPVIARQCDIEYSRLLGSKGVDKGEDL